MVMKGATHFFIIQSAENAKRERLTIVCVNDRDDMTSRTSEQPSGHMPGWAGCLLAVLSCTTAAAAPAIVCNRPIKTVLRLYVNCHETDVMMPDHYSNRKVIPSSIRYRKMVAFGGTKPTPLPWRIVQH